MQRIATIIFIGFTPIIFLFMCWLCIPGYVIPFYNHPVCRIAILALLLWSFIGMGIMFTARKLWQYALMSFVFQLPVMLLVALGPAVLTISSAVGPIMETSDQAPGNTVNEAPDEKPTEAPTEAPAK